MTFKMKTIIKTITFAVASVAVMGLAASCTDGFEDANRPGGALNNEEINRDNYSTVLSWFRWRLRLSPSRRIPIR